MPIIAQRGFSYSKNDNVANCVYEDGNVNDYNVDHDRVGVSPAFNVNLSSVIFSSEISSESGSYKLTLKDDNLSIRKNGTITRNGKTITVPYSATGTYNRVSILMTDKALTESGAAVKYYPSLGNKVTRSS